MTPYYAHGGITIYHGDCREVLPTLGTFDLLMTDPPYGIGASRSKGFGKGRKPISLFFKNNRNGAGAATPTYGNSGWDDVPARLEDLRTALSVCERAIVWGGNYFELGASRCYLVWDKMAHENDFADAELAWTNLDSAVRLIAHQWNGMLRGGVGGLSAEERWHPTQKPLAVIKWAISQAPESQSVLDPYLGSGTTLRAAKDAGLTAVGIEREERYCEIAAKRLSQEVLDFA